MSTIGFIGSGHIGSTVAQLAVDAGYDVVVSNSRGPETLADLVDRLGPRARAATSADAARAGDLVVLSIPIGRVEEVSAAPLAGKVVLDTGNYYPQRDGQVDVLDSGELTTSGYVQRHLPDAHVVKVFNNIFSEHLASMSRPAGAADRSALLIAGDDPDAKAAATAFLDAIGYDALDAGTLADSWRFQRDQPAYVAAYARDGDFAHPQPADADHLRALLAQGDPDLR